jgi:DNA (cytosine-5)-methyltransferase 1
MLRAIREIKPSWVVGENVRGLINWGGGVVFDEVQTDLETEGYEVLPFLLPACAVNAPHRRDRIWFIASHVSNTDSDGLQGSIQRKCNDKQEWHRQVGIIEECLYINKSNLETRRWQNFPIEPSICGRNDGLPKELDGITFSKWKIESIKAYGNAIVPQVAYEIFKAINIIENGKMVV